MRSALPLMIVLSVCLLSGCGGEGSAPDTGVGDTGQVDSGLPDGGVVSALAIVKGFPPVGPAGAAYSYTFAASGGTPPYSQWAVIKGVLPDGMSLNPSTGDLSGTPSAEGFSYFVVSVTDSASTVAKELFGIRIGVTGAEGLWHKRMTAFQDVYEKRHIWHGWSLNMFRPDDPNKDYWLSTYGDSSFMGGQCTAAMALRYAVERTPESLETITKLVDGWRFFQRLTGVPGLTGRGFASMEDPCEPGFKDGKFWPDDPSSDHYRGEGEFAGWIWIGAASRDQYMGAVLGNSVANQLVDDPHVKETTATFLAALADHVWDNGLKIIDRNGKMTKYGDMDGDYWEGVPMPNGQNAVLDLAWFKAAYEATGEERFNKYYRELAIKRKYIDYTRDYQWVYMGYNTKYYNVYMPNQAWWLLLTLEKDPALVSRYRAIYRDTMWLNTKDETTPNRRGIKEKNPVTGPWYMYSTGDRDPEIQYDYLWQMANAPDAPLRDHAVKNSDDPAIEKNPAVPKSQSAEALYPIPFNRRGGDMVIWHRNPYILDDDNNSGEERTGCDYLFPYWLGRYYGYISKDW